jgi:hypothetical protein
MWRARLKGELPMSEHQSEWQPHFALDLRSSRPKDLVELIDDFERWRKANPATGPVELANGWHTVTPQMAEDLLLRNLKNRKVVHAQVLYYAGQMRRNDWIETGQSLIFDTDGNLLDGQHRLWSGYLSSTAFPTYVISDVKPRADLFAYIDNNKARSMADALSTSGSNGLSGLMVQILKLLEVYDIDGFTVAKVRRMPKMSPMEMLHFSREHPSIEEAAHYVSSDGGPAARIVAHKAVAGFLALKLLETYDEAVLADFMTDLGTVDDTRAEDSPVAVFQEIMRKDRIKKKDQMASHVVLGLLIRTFNSWQAEEPVTAKKLILKVDEAFPRLVAPTETPDEPQAEAAE